METITLEQLVKDAASAALMLTHPTVERALTAIARAGVRGIGRFHEPYLPGLTAVRPRFVSGEPAGWSRRAWFLARDPQDPNGGGVGVALERDGGAGHRVVGYAVWQPPRPGMYVAARSYVLSGSLQEHRWRIRCGGATHGITVCGPLAGGGWRTSREAAGTDQDGPAPSAEALFDAEILRFDHHSTGTPLPDSGLTGPTSGLMLPDTVIPGLHPLHQELGDHRFARFLLSAAGEALTDAAIAPPQCARLRVVGSPDLSDPRLASDEPHVPPLAVVERRERGPLLWATGRSPAHMLRQALERREGLPPEASASRHGDELGGLVDRLLADRHGPLGDRAYRVDGPDGVARSLHVRHTRDAALVLAYGPDDASEPARARARALRDWR